MKKENTIIPKILDDFIFNVNSQEYNPIISEYKNSVDAIFKVLYNNGALKERSLMFREYDDGIFGFTIEVDNIREFEPEIKKSLEGTKNLDEILEYIFRSEHNLCRACRCFSISSSMVDYRGRDCLNKYNSCNSCKQLNNEEYGKTTDTMLKEGIYEAIKYKKEIW